MKLSDLTRKSHVDLEFDKFREDLAGYAKSARGKALAKDLEVEFDLERANLLLDQTGEALGILFSRADFESPVLNVPAEVEGVLKQAFIGGVLLKDDLKLLRGFLECSLLVDKFKKQLKPTKERRLSELLQTWESLALLHARFKKIFTNEGEVRDGASPALKKIRREIRAEERTAKKIIDGIVGEYQQRYGEEVHLSLRHNRFLVALPRGAKSAIDGIVVDLSRGGAQVLMEPERMIAVNNDRVRMMVEEEIEVRSILAKFSNEITEFRSEIEADLEIMGELDLIFARADFAFRHNCTRPRLEGANFELFGARHPFIVNFVPEDIRLEAPFRGMVVSGVNAGGKTVLLKLVGLATLMAYFGCFIPAEEGSSVPLVGAVFADISDDQSIREELSTFTSHLNFLKGLDAWLLGGDGGQGLPALVLMDEIGGGTEPTEGEALAYGVMAYLLEQRAIPILTTHYDLLKGMAFKFPEIKNISLEFDEAALKPTFRVIEGQPGKSFALDIAGTFGVSKRIVDTARSVLTSREKILSDVIRELDELRRESERRAREVEKLEEAGRALKIELEEKKEAFVRVSKRLAGEVEKKLDELLSEAKKKIKGRVLRRKDAADVKLMTEAHKVAKEVKREIESKVEEAYEELDIERFVIDSTARSPEPGDIVLISGTNAMGKVVEVDVEKRRATLEVGGLRVSAGLGDLALIDAKEYDLAKKLKGKGKAAGERMDRELSVAVVSGPAETRLDLHGMTTEESFEALEVFMDNALRSGIAEIEIMHGVGTGALKRFVGNYMRQHSLVSHVRSASPSEGGVGVTIAVLGKKGEKLGK